MSQQTKNLDPLLVQDALGINVEKRIIYLTGEVQLDDGATILDRIERIRSVSGNPTDDILLMISSYGGDANGMFSVIDAISVAPVKINTLVIGVAMSAGAIAALSATGKRYITPNATFMVHQVHAWLEGSTSQAMALVENQLSIQTRMLQILESRTKKDTTFWKKKIDSSDHYISAVQALEYGMVDEIITNIKELGL